jgi:hypothetical protein
LNFLLTYLFLPPGRALNFLLTNPFLPRREGIELPAHTFWSV